MSGTENLAAGTYVLRLHIDQNPFNRLVSADCFRFELLTGATP